MVFHCNAGSKFANLCASVLGSYTILPISPRQSGIYPQSYPKEIFRITDSLLVLAKPWPYDGEAIRTGDYQMSGFCGWAGQEVSDSGAVLEMMGARLSAGTLLAHPKAAVAVSTEDKTGSSVQDDQFLCAIEGYPHWSDPLLAGEAQERGHTAALLSAYRKFGPSLLERLKGAFALAVIDRNRNEALLAIDRMGIQTLCYSNPKPGLLVFGSTTDSVRAHPTVEATISPQALYDFFYFIDRVPAPETIYKEQSKLPPGHYLQLKNGEIEVKPYWQMSYAPEIGKEDALKSELLERLRAAIAKSLEGEDPHNVGAFLSGGLDSSTVLGLLAEQVPEAKSFTIGFDTDGFDETPYAKLAAKSFESRHDVYYLQPDDVVTAIPKIAAIYDEPFANSSAVPAYFCALRAKQAGVQSMLAGDGGDEIFAGNSRYLSDSVFDRYRLIPRPLRRGIVEPLVGAVPGLRRVPLLRKVPNYVDVARRSVPERMFGENLYRTVDPTEIFRSDVLAEISRDGPRDLANSIYDDTPSESKYQRMMNLDLRLILADSDIRKVSRMCELAGVRVRYPMLDDDLVAFSATIPPDLFMKGGLRGFYKRAVANLLPPEILTKEKKGFGLPYMNLLANHQPLKDLVCDSLQSLKTYCYFQDRFLDQATDDLRAGQLGRLRGVEWDFMMLEKWLELRMGA